MKNFTPLKYFRLTKNLLYKISVPSYYGKNKRKKHSQIEKFAIDVIDSIDKNQHQHFIDQITKEIEEIKK